MYWWSEEAAIRRTADARSSLVDLSADAAAVLFATVAAVEGAISSMSRSQRFCRHVLPRASRGQQWRIGSLPTTSRANTFL